MQKGDKMFTVNFLLHVLTHGTAPYGSGVFDMKVAPRQNVFKTPSFLGVRIPLLPEHCWKRENG